MIAFFEVADRVVADIRLDFLVELVGRLFELPVANSRRFASHEILKIDRLIFRPHPTRAAKIGHARFRADACAGEENNVVGLSQMSGEFFQLHRSPAESRKEIIWAEPVELVLPAAPALLASGVAAAARLPAEHPTL